eukprot:SAG31_NODE_4365_length_3307_cov_10.960723_4_plen_78_part_00
MSASAALLGDGVDGYSHENQGPNSVIDCQLDDGDEGVNDIVRRAFVACDIDGNGGVDRDELFAMLGALGCNITREEV